MRDSAVRWIDYVDPTLTTKHGRVLQMVQFGNHLMKAIPKPRIIGRHITLSDEGEGWFAGYADVRGTVESVIQSNRDDNPYYVVRFESPLELQESGAATPSGFILRHYSHCLVHCRWEGADINRDKPVSVHVLLVPTGTELPRSKADIVGLKISAWAACVVARDSRT